MSTRAAVLQQRLVALLREGRGRSLGYALATLPVGRQHEHRKRTLVKALRDLDRRDVALDRATRRLAEQLQALPVEKKLIQR
jgi:hypothetical protein